MSTFKAAKFAVLSVFRSRSINQCREMFFESLLKKHTISTEYPSSVNVLALDAFKISKCKQGIFRKIKAKHKFFYSVIFSILF